MQQCDAVRVKGQKIGLLRSWTGSPRPEARPQADRREPSFSNPNAATRTRSRVLNRGPQVQLCAAMPHGPLPWP